MLSFKKQKPKFKLRKIPLKPVKDLKQDLKSPHQLDSTLQGKTELEKIETKLEQHRITYNEFAKFKGQINRHLAKSRSQKQIFQEPDKCYGLLCDYHLTSRLKIKEVEQSQLENYKNLERLKKQVQGSVAESIPDLRNNIYHMVYAATFNQNCHNDEFHLLDAGHRHEVEIKVKMQVNKQVVKMVADPNLHHLVRNVIFQEYRIIKKDGL